MSASGSVDAGPPPAPPRRKVLVVEDSALLAMLLEDVLEELGWEVVGPATRVAAACELARHAEFEVALLDVNLNGEMAWDVADLLKHRGVPFAFSTGYDGATVMPPQFADTPVIAKPYALKEVGRKLRELAGDR